MCGQFFNRDEKALRKCGSMHIALEYRWNLISESPSQLSVERLKFENWTQLSILQALWWIYAGCRI